MNYYVKSMCKNTFSLKLINNHGGSKNLVHYNRVFFNMKDDVQSFIVSSHLACLRVVA